MQKQTLTFIIILLLAPTCLLAQDGMSQWRNNLQLELGGHGLFYSLNYEHVFLNADRLKTTAQAGIGAYPVSTGIMPFWFPVSVNQLLSFGNHHLELGAGMVPALSGTMDTNNEMEDWYWMVFLSGRVGYRYQKPGGKFLIRAGFTPLLEVSWLDFSNGSNLSLPEWHPLGAVSFGYCF